jgi:PPOX class probable FMN-dependent enzyme
MTTAAVETWERQTRPHTFREPVTSAEELRDLVGTPAELAIRKVLTALDEHCRSFIAHSPFVLLGTTDAAGRVDVSPRGDAPGFVLVLDDQTLVIPDRPGNRRIDSFQNVLENPGVGLLFEETLRINGRAQLVRDPDVLERMSARDKVPMLALVVHVEEAFLHCGKALRRSQLWQPATWPERSVMPTAGKIWLDQTRPEDTTVEEMDCRIEDSYTTRLY